MENSKKINSMVAVTGLLLVLLAVVNIIFLAGRSEEIAHPFGVVVNVLVALFGAFYIFFGAKKNPGSVLLKTYYVLCMLSTIILMCVEGAGSVSTCVFYAIAFAGYSVLTLANDLGEWKSKIIAFVIVFAKLIPYVIGLGGDSGMSPESFGQLSGLVVALSILALVWAKYADKKARGRA